MSIRTGNRCCCSSVLSATAILALSHDWQAAAAMSRCGSNAVAIACTKHELHSSGKDDAAVAHSSTTTRYRFERQRFTALICLIPCACCTCTRTHVQIAAMIELYQHLPSHHRVHFTPSYSIQDVDGRRYPYLNKPNAMKHWLTNAQPPIAETVVAVVDPDMIILKPITPYLDADSTIYAANNEAPPTTITENGIEVPVVSEGYPVAQVNMIIMQLTCSSSSSASPGALERVRR